jgi:hypothetical protein
VFICDFALEEHMIFEILQLRAGRGAPGSAFSPFSRTTASTFPVRLAG